MEETSITVALPDLSGFVRELLVTLSAKETATVLALAGDLGAGKTTFVQTLATELGVSEPVTSPTFTILKGYETTDTVWSQLLHMDAYRIEDSSELGPLQFNDLINTPDTLFCIEWAEKISDYLPVDTVWLQFSNTTDDTARTVQIRRPSVNG